MSVQFDSDDLRKWSKDLAAAPKRLTEDVSKLLDKHAGNAARAARAAAPKDRPWLSTEEGIQVTRPEELVRRVVSGLDSDGQSVGYRVEYGTSVMAARPFLMPAMRRERELFNAAALDAAVKVLR